MWLADQQFVLPSDLTGVPNKVAGECIYMGSEHYWKIILTFIFIFKETNVYCINI